jgi:hypothetical protein
VPHIIHFERPLLTRTSSYKLWELVLYQQSLKPEEQFEIMFEDCLFEPLTSANGGTELIDFAVGSSGALSYLNLRGFYRPERASKIARLAEIIDDIKVRA